MIKTEHALRLIREAKEAVSQELARNAAGAGTIGTSNQLVAVRQKLEAMEHSICDGALPPKSSRDRGMGRMVSDSWPLGSALGEMVLSAEEVYVRL